MNRQKIIIAATAIALAILIAGGAAQAQRRQQGGPRGKDMGPGRECAMHNCPMFFGNPDRMKKELGLNDSQVNSIQDINQRYKRQFLDFKEKLAPKRVQLQRLMIEDTIDLNQVRQKMQEISAIMVDMKMLHVQQKVEIDRVLTPEQRSKLRQMRPKGPRDGRCGGCPRGMMDDTK